MPFKKIRNELTLKFIFVLLLLLLLWYLAGCATQKSIVKKERGELITTEIVEELERLRDKPVPALEMHIRYGSPKLEIKLTENIFCRGKAIDIYQLNRVIVDRENVYTEPTDDIETETRFVTYLCQSDPIPDENIDLEISQDMFQINKKLVTDSEGEAYLDLTSTEYFDDSFDLQIKAIANVEEKPISALAVIRASELISLFLFSRLAQGIEYLHQGNLEQAISEFKEIIEEEPNFAEAHNNLGVAYLRQNDLTSACAEFEEAVIIEPDFVDAHYNLGDVYIVQGKMDLASGQFLDVLTINPDDVQARVKLGQIYFQENRLEEATVKFVKVIEIDPANSKAHLTLGFIYGRQGEVDDAIAEFEKTIEIAESPQDLVSAYLGVGAIYEELGALRKAVDSYNHVIDIMPEDPDNLREKIESLQEQLKLQK